MLVRLLCMNSKSTASVRIGPRMRDVVSFVTRNPGLPMLAAAEHVGPHGSRNYGYRTVHRAIDAGLVERRPGPRGSWLLYPVGAS